MTNRQSAMLNVCVAVTLAAYAFFICSLLYRYRAVETASFGSWNSDLIGYAFFALALLAVGIFLFILGYRDFTRNRMAAREYLAHRKITEGILKSADQLELLKIFASETSKILNAERTTIYQVSEEKLISAYAEGENFPIELEFGSGIAGHVAAARKSYFSNMPYHDPHFRSDFDLKTNFITNNVAAVPVIMAGQLAGVLSVVNKKGGFNEADMSLMGRLANQAGVVLAKAMLERQIRNEKEILESIFKSMSDGLYIIDRNYKITYMNRPLIEANGECVGQFCYKALHKLPGPCEGCPVEDTLEKGQVGVGTIGTDGRKYSEIASSPLLGEDEIMRGSVQVMRDISTRKRLEKKLVQAEKLSAIGQLVSGIAHELNNPLTGVIGYSELLIESNLDERAKQDVQKILDNAVRSQAIVKKLLTFARQSKPEKSETDLNEIVQKSLSAMEVVMERAGVKSSLDLDRNLPKTYADPLQMQQVFVNLIHNAVQAMPQGGELRLQSDFIATYSPDRGDNGRQRGLIRIKVQDNGQGIQRENLKQIFTPFFTTKPIGTGTGLGLSISYGIVQEHGGQIFAESKPNRGSVFTVELPVLSQPKAEDPVKRSRADRSAGKLRILVVDDEPPILELIDRVLTMEGHFVERRESGRKALELLQSEVFDVILLDLKMPDINGFQVYQKLAEDNPAAASRIIFVSGDTVSEKTRILFEKSGCPHIDKPFDIEELKNVVEHAHRQISGGGKVEIERSGLQDQDFSPLK